MEVSDWPREDVCWRRSQSDGSLGAAVGRKRAGADRVFASKTVALTKMRKRRWCAFELIHGVRREPTIHLKSTAEKVMIET